MHGTVSSRCSALHLILKTVCLWSIFSSIYAIFRRYGGREFPNGGGEEVKEYICNYYDILKLQTHVETHGLVSAKRKDFLLSVKR